MARRARAQKCFQNGQPIGFCVYFFSYSTWLGKQGLYLEDLYISPTSRGSGAGKQMLRHLAQIACETGCGRFEWSVLDWNEPAIGFYESIGAGAQSLLLDRGAYLAPVDELVERRPHPSLALPGAATGGLGVLRGPGLEEIGVLHA